MSPHMHLRGKSFLFEARYPNGQREILLDVPRFDFNWQFDYSLSQPKPMAKGTRVRCVAHFDNSEANLANPDPAATVRWGDQIWEEMMIGGMSIAPANQDLTAHVGLPVRSARTYRLVTFAIVALAGIVVVVPALSLRLWRRTGRRRS